MNNPAIYDAVICGAGGAGFGQAWLNCLNVASYNDYVDGVQAVALAVDGQIPPIIGGASPSQVSLMTQVTFGALSGRYPHFKNSWNYTEIGGGIATLWSALANVLTNEPEYVAGDGWEVSDIGKALIVQPGGSIAAQSVQGGLGIISVQFTAEWGSQILQAVTVGQLLVVNQVSIETAFGPGASIQLGTSANPVKYLNLINFTAGGYNSNIICQVEENDFLVLSVSAISNVGSGVLYYEVMAP